MEAILEMLFFSLSNVNIWFGEKNNLTQKNCTVTEALSTTKREKLINKRECTKMAMDENTKIFMVPIAILSALLIHSSQEVQLELLQANKTTTEVTPKYSDYGNIFSPDLLI